MNYLIIFDIFNSNILFIKDSLIYYTLLLLKTIIYLAIITFVIKLYIIVPYSFIKILKSCLIMKADILTINNQSSSLFFRNYMNNFQTKSLLSFDKI